MDTLQGKESNFEFAICDLFIIGGLFLTLSTPQTRKKGLANSEDPDETAHRNRLISIYTVCLLLFYGQLAYQVMISIRGRLIIPFILGSMSVGLNILIRHSFTDL